MLDTADLVAFAASSDLARSTAFYRDVLGLALVDESPFACLFDAHGTPLRVTLVPELVHAPYTVLGWRVPDIAAAIAALRDRGVAFTRYDGFEQDEDGVWTAPSGTLIAWFADPDGNLVSLEQRPAA